MNSGYLSEYFTGVWTKALTKVDATASSNQHEIGDRNNEGALLKLILGDAPRKGGNRFQARYVWLQDEQETVTDNGFLSWYDTRENQPGRSPEWRLYYQTNQITTLMNEGDRLYVARSRDGTVFFIVVPSDSALGKEVGWLFGIQNQLHLDYSAKEIEGQNDSALDFISRLILDELGIEFEDPNANTLDSIIEKFGTTFPGTVEFSDLARLTLPEINARDDADLALLAWLNHEEAMFRRLERRVVAARIQQGFMEGDDVDVDAFVKFSLSVHNRRKSRMGYSFQNHLEAVFKAFELRYDSQVRTENGKKPDFLFPGAKEYRDPMFSVELLTMLAAKSTCKDRWPQVLPEAERIPVKHLVTLEPGISEAQTTTMQKSGVQLIVPGEIQASYTRDQQDWLWSVSDFVGQVSQRQEMA